MQEIDYDIKKTNLYEIIADKLEDMIVKDANQLGEQLPSEQTLANSFGVSRNVIREAFKILKERGLIMLRAGGRAYISRPEADVLTNLIGRIVAMDGTEDLDVLEMRILLETKSCYLAAQKATDPEIDELETITRHMEAVFDNYDERAELDISFHTRMAEIAGNRLLTLFVNSMVNLLFTLIARAMRAPYGMDSGIVYHKKIIDAMRKRDADLASDIMREHLEESKKRYLSALEKKE